MNYEVDFARPIIDAHIHLDQYKKSKQQTIIDYLERPSSELHGVITVSKDYLSCTDNLQLAETHAGIRTAFGYHPEQAPPSDVELEKLFSFMELNKNQMVAIGEVGLPYYLRQEEPRLPLEPYYEMLEAFIHRAKNWDKPINLHAVYEDADIVCDLLEKHSVDKAHFHWFKGFPSTFGRMIRNDYYVSVTPDCIYEPEIQHLIESYPINRLMVETDGPWPFSGPFEGEMTHPKMIHRSIAMIAAIKKMDLRDVYVCIFENTKRFYLD
ncbi:TatD family hydrolase [Sporosarcina sp. CAU 1771]